MMILILLLAMTIAGGGGYAVVWTLESGCHQRGQGGGRWAIGRGEMMIDIVAMGFVEWIC
jgi:hypothetical protein